jgi:putative transposase
VNHSISQTATYFFNSLLEVSDAKRLKALEDENAKLKKLLAEAELDKAMLKEIAAKNVWSAPSVQGSWT